MIIEGNKLTDLKLMHLITYNLVHPTCCKSACLCSALKAKIRERNETRFVPEPFISLLNGILRKVSAAKGKLR
jgi:hypothetical protein